jgi:hypothetical protein
MAISKKQFDTLAKFVAESRYLQESDQATWGYSAGYESGKQVGIDYAIRELTKDKDGWYDFGKDPAQRVYDQATELVESWQRTDEQLNGLYTDLGGSVITVETYTYDPDYRKVVQGDDYKVVKNGLVVDLVFNGLWTKVKVEEATSVPALDELLEELS